MSSKLIILLFLVFIYSVSSNSTIGSVNLWNFSLEDLVTREERVLHTSQNNIPTTHVLNRPINNNNNNNNNHHHNRITSSGTSNIGGSNVEVIKEVTETDLYLLGALEKLVYRMDLMDQRLRRAEELVQHVMEGSNIKRQDPCPANFTRISQNCYHFNERQYNWKSANSMCKSLGGNLIELEDKKEYVDVITYILADQSIRGHDYWTGGLNPGLLWIWSNSARPVVPKNSTQPDDMIPGGGRCLKLSFTGQNRIYSYFGSECSIRFRFICEHEENITDRALKRIHKALNIPNY